MQAERHDFRLLGPLEVWVGGEPLPLGGAKQRVTLAVLLLHANEPVSSDRLIDALWGERPPGTAKTALQGYITQLRRLLEPTRKKRAAGEVLVTTPAGYVLQVAEGALDRDRFEALAAKGHEALAAGRSVQAAELCRSALELWRGPALAEFAYDTWAQSEAERLTELRLVSLEERIEADLELGRHAQLVGELEALVSEQPLRERPRALLMLALYRAGRQAEALEAYQAARGALVDELGIDPSPELRELEAAILRQDAKLASPAPDARPPTNLPAPAAPLVGRERELGEAGALLAREDVRLLTLTGAGGSGKTRLALALAKRFLPRFGDGVFLCELASVSDRAIALSAISQTLGLKEARDVTLIEQLEGELKERELLLVLDNLEQILDVGPPLAELLASCPALTILATSRAPLHLAAEHEYPVDPLPESDAVELFRQRAEAVRPGFTGNGEVSEICDRLDRLPLAIELAAARTKVLSLDAILERLEQRLPLLTGGARDLPERQRTLHATLDWSYQLLETDEQRLFRHLGVFARSFTLEAVVDICQANLDTLSALVDKSLLGFHRGRYSMLETVRQFAAELLDEEPEADALRQRHADWVRALVQAAEQGFESAEVGAWYERVEREFHEIRAALAWSEKEGNTQIQLAIAGSLTAFWYGRGSWREGRRWLESALAKSGPERSAARARALGTHALLGPWREQRSDEALAEMEESLLIYRELGDTHKSGVALVNLAHLSLALGRNEEAEHLFGEVAELAEQTDDVNVRVLAEGNLGMFFLDRGEYDLALSTFQRALIVAEESGLPADALWLMQSRAVALALLGDDDRAAVANTKALTAGYELKEPTIIAACLMLQATLLARRKAFSKAATLIGSVDALRDEVSVPIEPVEERVLAETTHLVKTQLGQARFQAAHSAGVAMSLDKAVCLALGNQLGSGANAR